MKVKKGIYKHYKKGKQYRVLGVGKHSETYEDMVVYEALYDNPVSQLWVRPLEIFTERVEHEGKHIPRFLYQEEG